MESNMPAIYNMKSNVVAKFEKVSYEQFKKDIINSNSFYRATSMTEEQLNEEITEMYDSIKLPKRSTIGSAGYDFCTPFSIFLNPNSTLLVPTGIRAKIEDGWFLALYPRSGSGFKYGIRLANTCGIIDSDYYNADNEGHIMIKLVRDDITSKVGYSAEAGIAFAQGIFMPYGITEDDEVNGIRTGGFGSTDKR